MPVNGQSGRQPSKRRRPKSQERDFTLVLIVSVVALVVAGVGALAWIAIPRIAGVVKGAIREKAELVSAALDPDFPDIQGYGDLPQFRIAAATSPELQERVKRFRAEKDPAERAELVPDIIFAWGGLKEPDPTWKNIDSRKYFALAAFQGKSREPIPKAWRNGKPGPQASKMLEEAFSLLRKYVYWALSAQTHYRSVTRALANPINIVATTPGSTAPDVATPALRRIYDDTQPHGRDNINDLFALFKEANNPAYNLFLTNVKIRFSDRLDFTGKDSDDMAFEEFLAGMDYSRIVGTDGDDSLHAPLGGAIVIGKGGNDALSCNRPENGEGESAGWNYLCGGPGDDVIESRGGGNTLVWGEGDGSDIVRSFRGKYGDTLMVRDILSDGIVARFEEADGCVVVANGADSVRIEKTRPPGSAASHGIDALHFPAEKLRVTWNALLARNGLVHLSEKRDTHYLLPVGAYDGEREPGGVVVDRERKMVVRGFENVKKGQWLQLAHPAKNSVKYSVLDDYGDGRFLVLVESFDKDKRPDSRSEILLDANGAVEVLRTFGDEAKITETTITVKDREIPVVRLEVDPAKNTPSIFYYSDALPLRGLVRSASVTKNGEEKVWEEAVDFGWGGE